MRRATPEANKPKSSLKPSYEELEKQLDRQQAKFEKEKGYLLQKIELMDMKLKEAQEREQNIERLHNTMLKAFKNDDATEKKASFVQEYEVLSDLHRKEMSEAVKSYEVQVSHLKEKNNELSEKCSGLTSSCNSMQKEIKRLLTENTQLEKKILILEKDQEVEQRLEVERLVMERSKEQNDARNQLRHENEKANEVFKEKEQQWKSQLSQAENEIKSLKNQTQRDKG